MRDACRNRYYTRTLELHCSGRRLSGGFDPIGGRGLMGDCCMRLTLVSPVRRAWYGYISTHLSLCNIAMPML